MLGWLADGTPHYAPVGVLLVDGDRVCCHLCGKWFLSVASHLRHHGWTKTAYVNAFGLELGNPLSGPATRKRRSEALSARDAEPAIRQARLAARERTASGELAAAAARAARGRAHPAERRVKTLAALGEVDPAARAAGNRRRGERHRERITADVARRFGFPTFEEYLVARVRAGLSMAAISREAGLHKDWVSRHAPATSRHAPATSRQAPATSRQAPATSRQTPATSRQTPATSRQAPATGRQTAATSRPTPGEARLGPHARSLGYADAAAYLRAAHVEQHRSIAAIALETSTSRWTVLAALRHHGIEARAHATKRHHAQVRESAAARALGFASIAAYVAARRAEGAPWTALAAESGIAATSLRRRQKRGCNIDVN